MNNKLELFEKCKILDIFICNKLVVLLLVKNNVLNKVWLWVYIKIWIVCKVEECNKRVLMNLEIINKLFIKIGFVWCGVILVFSCFFCILFK